MKKFGKAVWRGGIKEGKGTISTESGALKEYPYGFSSQFEGKPGPIRRSKSGLLTLTVSPWPLDIDSRATAEVSSFGATAS